MRTFKTIEKLGLSITTWCGDPRTSAVLAQELETLLQSAQVVYGGRSSTMGKAWFEGEHSIHTHTALLINITPIKKQTKAEAALEFVESIAKDTTKFWNVATLDEAKRILQMKDEV